MTITLADVFMMTGLNVSLPVYPYKYKSKSNQRAVSSGCGWVKHIQNYMNASGAVSDKELKAFMNMWLCRFIFCGKSNEPTLNHMVMAEDLAAGTQIPLGKYLLGSVYHMMHQITLQMWPRWRNLLCEWSLVANSNVAPAIYASNNLCEPPQSKFSFS